MNGLLHQTTVTSVNIPAGSVELEGDLTLPQRAQGVVLFAHGSGSSRKSPRNRQVAAYLNEGGLGTLLIDLLSAAEERIDLSTAELRFNLPLLAERLNHAIRWLENNESTFTLPIGLFGSSTGAGAALVAASHRTKEIAAVVSRGGRVDLAGEALGKVRCPTLLIVGELDDVVVDLNQGALDQLRSTKSLEIIPGATHLFEEHGALEEVAHLARHWFQRFLVSGVNL